jgi:hypothetical protein
MLANTNRWIPTLPKLIEKDARIKQRTKSRIAMPSGSRWTWKRKHQVLRELQAGEATASQICANYSLSAEELQMWIECYERYGASGLKEKATSTRRSNFPAT